MKKSKKSDFGHKSEHSGAKGMLFSALFGNCISFASFIAFILILSGICLCVDNPHTIVLPLCLVSLYASAFVGGFAAIKKNRGADALLCSGLSGAMLTAELWMVFAILKKAFGITQMLSMSTVFKLIIIPMTVIGGLVSLSGSNKKPKRKFKGR